PEAAAASIYPLSLHDALPILQSSCEVPGAAQSRNRSMGVEVRVGDYARDNTNFYAPRLATAGVARPVLEGGLAVPIEDNYDEIRSEEHTSELQSRSDLVCRLL